MVEKPVTAWHAGWAHDPDAAIQPFSRRKQHSCYTDPKDMPQGKAVMRDTNVCIYREKGSLPGETAAFVDDRTTVHSGVALAELTITADPAAWIEAGMLSGILARTQLVVRT
jgi:hypothetical protein